MMMTRRHEKKKTRMKKKVLEVCFSHLPFCAPVQHKEKLSLLNPGNPVHIFTHHFLNPSFLYSYPTIYISPFLPLFSAVI